MSGKPTGKPPAASAPIPIASRRPVPHGGKGAGDAGGVGLHYLSASVPAAPIIGSMKAPAHLDNIIPEFSLPPSSPEAFSLALASTEQLHAAQKARMVGVSSAPSVSFMEHARRAGAGPSPLGLGTSPTVLSILATRGADDMSAAARSLGKPAPLGVLTAIKAAPGTGAGEGKREGGDGVEPLAAGVSGWTLEEAGTFAKVSSLPVRAVGAPSESGLSTMMKKGSGAGSMAGSGSGGGTTTGSGGMPGAGGHVVLAASFRDPMRLPMGGTIREEDGSDGDSDVDLGGSGMKPSRHTLTIGAGRGVSARGIPTASDDSDDEDAQHTSPTASSVAGKEGIGKSGGDEGGIFEGEF